MGRAGAIPGQHLLADLPAGRMGEGIRIAEEVRLGAEGGEAQGIRRRDLGSEAGDHGEGDQEGGTEP